eukprot:3846069-Pyramimonas_sp.AAC.2
MEPSQNPLFKWLEGLSQEIWTDPTCGNGICEPPYEFPAYETYVCIEQLCAGDTVFRQSVVESDSARLGCQIDCGLERDLKQIVVVVEVGNPTFLKLARAMPC